MILHRLLTYVLYALLPVALLANTYLYAYPLFRPGCAFTQPAQYGSSNQTKAPFRLLAFGDPQLEGDTALPYAPQYEPAEWSDLLVFLRKRQWTNLLLHSQDILDDLVDTAKYRSLYIRKQLDLIGNDYYLAHVYRTLHWFAAPTHVTVLGDLLGSQWIRDDEFASRSRRFWDRVFRGGVAVPHDALELGKDEAGNVLVPEEELAGNNAWSRRIINVAGNHDIGYAGDLDEGRIERFERVFGPVNGGIRFRLGETGAALRLVVLNSMNMDAPQLSEHLAWETLSAINDAITSGQPVESHNEAVILLTHIPLHKPAGVCVDSPMFSYFESGHIKEQNFLSYDIGRDAILQGIFGMHPHVDAAARGMGRDGIILTGHDHEGCDVYHYANRESDAWKVQQWENPSTAELVQDTDQPGIREVTVRSMMGEYGGNAALLTAWWNESTGRWSIEVRNCLFVVQHVWWAVHIMDIVLAVVAILWTLSSLSQVLARSSSSTAAKAVQRDAKAAPRGRATPLTENGKNQARQRVVPQRKKHS